MVGLITVRRVDFALADGANAGGQATCAAGTKAIGGGATVAGSGGLDVNVVLSRPYSTVAPDLPEDGGTFDSWRVVYSNAAGGTGATTARVFVVCAQA